MAGLVNTIGALEQGLWVEGAATIRAVTEVLEKRESRSKPDRGIVTFEHRGFNQRDELVCRCVRLGMMLRKPAA